MSDSARILFDRLSSIETHWGIQYIPAGSPLGPAGFVVNVGFDYFWAATLEQALQKAIDSAGEQAYAILQQ